MADDSDYLGGYLSMARRRAMPASEFALPGHGSGASGKGAGSYPIDTPGRARNALARGAQHASPAERATIKRKVHAKYPSIKIAGGYTPNQNQGLFGAIRSLNGMPPQPPSSDQNQQSSQQQQPGGLMGAIRSLQGGYVANPTQNAAIHASKPRSHALALASATHLRNMGHITPEHHARIATHTHNALAALRVNKQPPAAPPAMPMAPSPMGDMGAAPMPGASAPFGSFAPQ